MALCDKCLFYDKQNDEKRQQYNDVAIAEGKNEKHFCPMFLSGIPNKIFYRNGNCRYFEVKNNDH